MFKSNGLIVLIICLSFGFGRASSLNNDKDLVQILRIHEKSDREQKLFKFIKDFFESAPLNNLSSYSVQLDEVLKKHDVSNRAAFNYFVRFVCQRRQEQPESAERSLVKAINIAARQNNTYLLYAFYNQLGLMQNNQGNTTEAVYSFSIAKKQAIVLNSYDYQVVACVNISDAFYKNGFYQRSLSYLREAQLLINEHDHVQPRLQNIVYNNIIENYFRMGRADSVAKYRRLLHALPANAYKKYIYTKRADYYFSILKRNYNTAIAQIIALKADSLFQYNNIDDKNLAEAYFHLNKLDSAKQVLDTLLANPTLNKQLEIKYAAYKLLGNIAEKQQDIGTASENFKLALQQSETRLRRSLQVDNIASQIKINEVESAYLQKEAGYKKERLGLIYVLLICTLTIAFIGMIYSVTRQKRHYERLVFNAKKTELSFINSHEVRRHLSNLLGLMDVIKASENKYQQYQEAEPMILREVQALDAAIKTISEKLEADNEITKPAKDQHNDLA